MIICITRRCVKIPFRSLLVKLDYTNISRLQYIMIILVQSYNVQQVNIDNDVIYVIMLLFISANRNGIICNIFRRSD